MQIYFKLQVLQKAQVLTCWGLKLLGVTVLHYYCPDYARKAIPLLRTRALIHELDT